MRALALILTFALSADGAITYRVQRDTDAALQSSGGMRVTIAGDNICIEADQQPGEPVMYNALVSRDAGTNFTAINHENQTWYPSEGSPLTLVVNRCGMTKDAKIGKVKWLFTEPESHRYVATLSFTMTERLDGHKVDITCTAALDITTTDAHPRELWPDKRLFRTAVPSIDAQIAGDLAGIKGFPTRIALTSSRQYKGGALYKSKTVLATEDVRTVPDGAVRACERPANYREQKPVLGFPGVTERGGL